MKFAKLFPPGTQDDSEETCTIGSTFALNSVVFQPIPAAEIPTITWVDGGSALLFSTPSRAVAVIKICAITTEQLKRTQTITRTYLLSITADTDKFLVRAQGLSNPEEGITACLQRDIPKVDLPTDTTPDLLLDPMRTLAEHCVSGGLIVHDGSTRTSHSWLAKQLGPAAAIAKTSHLLTSKSRPIGMALLMKAPPGSWYAQLTPQVTCARLNDKASHVFLVEQATPELLAALQAWSNDLAFPGYPYPFILADQLARVTNNERDAWKLIIAGDSQAAAIISGELKATDAHAMLEHILYGKELL